jgi:hypothetical protein
MVNFFKSVLRFAKTAILSLLLICLVIFMVNNRDIITIHAQPLPFEIEIRVFVLMIFFFLFGMSFGFLAFSKNMISGFLRNFKDRLKIKKLEKQVLKVSKS